MPERTPRHWTPGAITTFERHPTGAVVLRRLLLDSRGAVLFSVHERTCSDAVEAAWYCQHYGAPEACPAPWGSGQDPVPYGGGAACS